MTAPKFTVGQTVVMRDANEHRLSGPGRGVVTRVARKLITVEPEGGGRESFYAIADGRGRDRMGHEWVQTLAEYDDEQRGKELRVALREHGVEIRGQRLSASVLASVLAVIEAAS